MVAAISMSQSLLDRGEDLWQQERFAEAGVVLRRLLGFRYLPHHVAERAQFYLADMALSEGQYAKARRHLAAALVRNDRSAEYHFLMACALDWDDGSDPQQVSYHYRRALELEPGQPLYSSAYALRRLRTETLAEPARTEVRQRLSCAFSAEPDDPDVVYNYVAGLLELGGHPLEAELALRRALRRWPDVAAFHELWHRGGGRPWERDDGATETPLPTPTILRFPVPRTPAPARPPAARSAARLRTALARCNAAQLRAIAQTLGLDTTRSVAASRDAIGRLLLDAGSLREVVRRLSPDSREIAQVLVGRTRDATKRFRVRVDGAETARPHLFSLQHRTGLDALCAAGLAFPRPVRLTRSAKLAAPADELGYFVPADLQPLLAELLTEPDAPRGHVASQCS